MPDVNNAFGKRLRELRKKEKLTQIELASSAGVAVNSIRLYEAGKRTPSTDITVKLARALGVSLIELNPLITLIPLGAVNKPTPVKVQDILNLIDARIYQDAKDPYDATGSVCWKDLKELYMLAANSDSVSHSIAMDTIASILYGGYGFSDNEFKLIKAFSALNNAGQIKAVERVEELSEITRYKDGGDQ